MTTISVILLGVGVLFIASALDNSSLQDTFRAIVNGNPIDWSGGKSDYVQQKGYNKPPSSGAKIPQPNGLPPVTVPPGVR